MIWAYRTPTPWGVRVRYGCPVDVHLAGRWVQVVYQFQGAARGDQTCAVVHWQSGQALAIVEERDVGHPQQRAQSAVNRRHTGADPGKVHAALYHAEVLNDVPRVFG